MLYRVVLSSVRGLQPIGKRTDLAHVVKVLYLDPCHEHPDATELGAWACDRYKGIARILVVQSELDPGRRDLPAPLVHQTKANYAGVRAEAIARFREEAHFPRFEHILRAVARGTKI